MEAHEQEMKMEETGRGGSKREGEELLLIGLGMTGGWSWQLDKPALEVIPSLL